MIRLHHQALKRLPISLNPGLVPKNSLGIALHTRQGSRLLEVYDLTCGDVDTSPKLPEHLALYDKEENRVFRAAGWHETA